MTYSSLQEIKSDFQITSNDTNEILVNLKSIRNETHPDRNKGDFQDEGIKEMHLKANNAIEYVEKMSANGQLIVIEQMTALIKQVTEIIPAQKQQSMETKLENRIDYQISHFRSPLSLPKFSLTGITAFFSFIVLFPKQAEENPVFKGILNFDSKGLVFPWLLTLSTTALFWMYAYILDDRTKRQLERFKLESYQNEIFSEFVHGRLEFGKDELALFIIRDHRRRNPIVRLSRMFGGTIPLDVAQALSDTILGRAERNNVVTKVPSASLSDSYQLNPQSGFDFRRN